MSLHHMNEQLNPESTMPPAATVPSVQKILNNSKEFQVTQFQGGPIRVSVPRDVLQSLGDDDMAKIAHLEKAYELVKAAGWHDLPRSVMKVQSRDQSTGNFRPWFYFEIPQQQLMGNVQVVDNSLVIIEAAVKAGVTGQALIDIIAAARGAGTAAPAASPATPAPDAKTEEPEELQVPG